MMKEMGPEAVLGSTVLPGKHQEGLPGWWKQTGHMPPANIAHQVSTFHSMGGTAEWKGTGTKGGGG